MTQAVQNFITWIFQNVPNFLMSEPVIYFVAFMLIAFAINMLRRIK